MSRKVTSLGLIGLQRNPEVQEKIDNILRRFSEQGIPIETIEQAVSDDGSIDFDTLNNMQTEFEDTGEVNPDNYGESFNPFESSSTGVEQPQYPGELPYVPTELNPEGNIIQEEVNIPQDYESSLLEQPEAGDFDFLGIETMKRNIINQAKLNELKRKDNENTLKGIDKVEITPPKQWKPGLNIQEGKGIFGKPGGFGSGQGKLSELPGKIADFKESMQGKGIFGKEDGFGSGSGALARIRNRIRDNRLYDEFTESGQDWGVTDTWGDGGLRKRGIFTGKEDGFGTGRGALSQWSPFEKGTGIFGKEGGFGSGEGALSEWSPFQQGFGSGEGKLAQWSPFQNIKEGKGIFGKEGGFGSGGGALANILSNIKTEGKGVFGKEGGFGTGQGKLNKASSALRDLGQKLFGKKASKVTKPIEKLLGSLTKERKYLGGESILQAARELTAGSRGGDSLGGSPEDFYYGGGGGGYGYSAPTLNPIIPVGMQSHHDFKKGLK